MKQNSLSFIYLAAIASLALNTLVADDSPNMMGRASIRGMTVDGDYLQGAKKSSDIIGLEVKNYQNEKLGKVDDLIVDLGSGRVVETVVSTGGILGMGDTLIAVPPRALHYDASNKVVHLEADKEKLKSAPRIEASQWNDASESNRVVEVYRYYGETPYFMPMTSNVHQDLALSPKAMDSQDNFPSNSITRRAYSTFGYLQKASKIKGMAVKNLQNEKVGKVENLMVDWSGGRVLAVIVSTGGFLGMGDELSAVPPVAFQLNADRNALQLDVSKEMLSSAPHFKANQWPDIGEPQYAHGVYRAYKVEPYFSTNNLPDNSAQNVRDRNNQTLTPLNQGNSKSDLDITSQIRKQVIAQQGLSMNAHNIKIITKDGHVTLRGPVKSADEKSTIADIASRVAQPNNVDNQLEVQTN